MFQNSFVDRALILLGIKLRTPPISAAAFVLMNEKGVVGALVDPTTGNLTDGSRVPLRGPIQNIYSASGAISVASQTAVITKTGSLAAMTLAVPVAGSPVPGNSNYVAGGQDGTKIEITSTTAFAHTITCPSAIINRGVTGDPVTVITLAAFPGGGVTLEAYNGKWQVVSNVLSTFA